MMSTVSVPRGTTKFSSSWNCPVEKPPRPTSSSRALAPTGVFQMDEPRNGWRRASRQARGAPGFKVLGSRLLRTGRCASSSSGSSSRGSRGTAIARLE